MKITNSNWPPYMEPVDQPIMMPNQGCPHWDMTEGQLAEMYPQIYHMVHPRVVNCCNKMEYEYGKNYVPCKEHVAEMVEDIHKNVCDDMDEAKKQGVTIKQWGRESKELPDLITILLLREIIGRKRTRYPYNRRRPGYGYGPGMYY